MPVRVPVALRAWSAGTHKFLTWAWEAVIVHFSAYSPLIAAVVRDALDESFSTPEIGGMTVSEAENLASIP